MTIEERFKQAFSDCLVAGFDIELLSVNPITNEKKVFKPQYKTYAILNLDKHFQEVAIVIEELNEEYQTIPTSAFSALNTIHQGKTGEGGIIQLGGFEFDSRELPFNNVIYIFAEKININKNQIEAFFKSQNLRVKIRDKEFFDKEFQERRHDLFICHDSRDKAEVVDPLYKALLSKNLKVWYDKANLRIGDSLTEKIQEGIRDCRYGIIVLSPNFLSNERWAKNELQSFTTRQIIENEKVILPVWHNINENDLKKVSYWLIDKIGGNANDFDHLVNQIYEVVKIK